MNAFRTSREIPATVEQVFAAFNNPERLARWWGPAGFTNTFKLCEFKPGGHWSFTMHGPNGVGNYPNESIFEDIEPPSKIVIHHVSEPKYRLTIGLTSSKVGTVVSWSQAFEKPDVAKRIEHIVVPANEQNLDRLTAEVLRSQTKNNTKNMTTLQDRIKNVYQEGQGKNWSYPQFFKALKEAGVRSYKVDVLKYMIEFAGDKETHLETGPADWKVTAGTFNKEDVIKAVRRIQRLETDYPTFLKEIAAAGIPKYDVSMTDNTVSYIGADPKNKYVEKVPAV